MPHPGLRFGIAALATWRLTHLLAEEDGPADVVVRARVRLGDSPAGALMDCFQCLSLGVAAPFAARAPQRTAWWLGLSGAACVLERATSRRQEDDDGLLWRAPRGAEGEPTGTEERAAAAASGAGSAAAAGGADAADPHRRAAGRSATAEALTAA